MSPDTPYIPDPSVLFEYTFRNRIYKHYMCKVCGCEVYNYGIRPEPVNGSRESFGINAALLNGIGEFVQDVYGLSYEVMGDRKGARMKGIFRDPADRLEEPRYRLHL